MLKNVKVFIVILFLVLVLVMGISAGATQEKEDTGRLSIAFLYSQSRLDGGYNEFWDKGRQSMDEHFGDQVETSFVEFVPWSEECTIIMEQLIADGVDMIVDTSDYIDFAETVAEAHPEVSFLRTGVIGYENEASFFFETGRGYYLLGAVAGLLSESGNNEIGYVGPFPDLMSNAWVSAFAMGARAVNPEATVTVAYIGSYYDPSSSTQAAEALADSGVDVLYGYVNPESVMNVAEERGIWTLGSYFPKADFAPNQYATGLLMDSGKFFINEVQALLDGTWVGNKEHRYVAVGDGLDLDDWGSNVPQDVIDQVNDILDQMVSEGYDPFTGPIYDNQGNLVVPDGERLTEEQIFFGFEWFAAGVSNTAK